MPPQTNEFQKIVYLIKKHSATGGATVNESKDLYDSAAEKKREVDVVIERIAGEERTIIGIECTKLKQKADVEWVERMLGKHRDLPTDVLILYSYRGFSKAAIKKAAHYRKTIIAMQTLDDSSADRLFGGVSSLWIKHGQLTPTKVIIRVLAQDDLPAENVFPYPDLAIYNAAREPQIKPRDYVPWLLQQPFAMPEFLKMADQTHKGFTLRMSPATDYWGNRLYVLKNDVTPNVLRLIDSIEITGKAEFFTAPVPIEHGKLGEDTVAWGTMSLGEKRLIVVASKDPSREMTASFDMF